MTMTHRQADPTPARLPHPNAGVSGLRLLLSVLLAALLFGCSEPDKPSISLYLAVQRGDLNQLERHLYWKTDINKPFPDGRYPLHIAAANGRTVLVKRLLGHDVEINVEDSDGDTPLDVALLNGRTQIADVLLDAEANLDATGLLLKAAERGIRDRDTVRYLVDRGADLEARAADGDTPLLIAVRRNNHRLVNHLLHNGADANAQSAAGHTALAIARDQGYGNIVTLLQQMGAIEK